MLSFLYVYSHHSILECYNLFSGVELSMRSFFVIGEIHYHKGKQNKWSKQIELSAGSNQFEKKIKSDLSFKNWSKVTVSIL